MTKKQVIFLKVAAVMSALFAIMAASGLMYMMGRVLDPDATILHWLALGVFGWATMSNYEFLKKIGRALEHNDASYLHT